MADLRVTIGQMELRNPVTTASGTCGFGEELTEFFDVSRIGGIFIKGLTLKPREGNPYPRMAETASGMLNSVGLQNKGIDYFTEQIYPRIRDLDTHIIANVNGSTIEEYVSVTEKLKKLESIPAMELNISCPNVKEGGMAFGISCPSASAVTKAVREVWDRTLIVKLSPNVTDIRDIALAVEEAGADAFSLINTLLGMAVDAEKRQPVLSTITGGLSGPAIKPIALRMVWQVAQVSRLPIVGIGGIMNATDAIEFMLAGASAIQVGTATFIDPLAPVRIAEGIDEYLVRQGCRSVREIIGELEND
ncbi:MAG: dihydroorotate dehydrogenase [Bacteroidales bacterium]|nr:dihydroorotate dehydrogenase [Lentimicrobiaceae bacterium]MDD5694049.1 dihydroorotate dehydrogenase [Bacteroidales bacterium]